MAAAVVTWSLVAAAPAGAQSAVRYVALGDSYSAGDGAGAYYGGSCGESANAYPALWAAAHDPAGYAAKTCDGATTSSVISGQLSALSTSTTLVSITVGGNDVGFSSVMETCVLLPTSSCVSAIDTAEGKISTSLPGELDNVLAAISADAPNARVVVLDYPDLYDLSKSSSCVGLSSTDRTDLDQGADQLDSQIQAAAAPARRRVRRRPARLRRSRDLRLRQLAELGELARPRRLLPPERGRPGRRLPAGVQRRRGRLSTRGTGPAGGAGPAADRCGIPTG